MVRNIYFFNLTNSVSKRNNLNLNPFSTNVPLLYPLKTSGNLRFSVFMGYRSGTLAENGLLKGVSRDGKINLMFLSFQRDKFKPHGRLHWILSMLRDFLTANVAPNMFMYQMVVMAILIRLKFGDFVSGKFPPL